LKFKNIRLDNFYEHKKNLANITLSNVIPGIEYNQIDFIREFFARLERDKDFAFGIIYDSFDNLYVQHIREGISFSHIDVEKRDFGDPAYYVIVEKMNVEPQGKLGTLVLGFNRQQIQDEISSMVTQIVIFLAILALIFTFLLYFLMERVVIQPLKKITKATERVAEGDLSARVPLSRRDELGNLGANFNQMAENLSRNFETVERAKNEIFQLQVYLNNIIESSPNGVITIDGNGRFVKVNKSAAKMLELDDGPLIGRLIYEVDLNFLKYQEAINEASAQRRSMHFDREQLNIAGKEKVFNILIYPVDYLDRGGVVILIVDMSERVSLEKQLVQSQKMEAIGTLAGGIAHDFNNILTIIMGYLSVLKFQVKEWKILDKINLIDAAAQRAAELVKQILVLSRKESGKFDHINLIEVLEDVLKMIKEFFPRSIKIQKYSDDESYPLYGDKNLLSQMLMNLLINARDAIEASPNKDSGYLQISLKEVYVDSYLKKFYNVTEDGRYVEMRISDNGCGMDEKIIASIFDPFFTSKPKGKGTGLGLSIVYSIVNNHGGVINVHSEKNVGSTFVILLPIGKDNKTKRAEAEQKLMHGSGNVIVVDDEPEILNTITDMLGVMGYDVQCFSNGSEFLEHYEKHFKDIDLVILDIMMPDMDGMKTYTKLKSLAADIPVVFSSGYFEDKLRNDFQQEVGEIFFLPKPFSIYELSRIVHQLIGKEGDAVSKIEH
jgi:PAS domain S-box-containing protein